MMKNKKIPIIIAAVLVVAFACGGFLYIQSENTKAAALVQQQEQAEAEQAEADRIAAEQAVAEQAEADRLAAEQAAAEQAEADRIEVEQATAEQAEAERLAAEQAAAEQAEAERIAAEQAAAKPKPTPPTPPAAPKQNSIPNDGGIDQGPEGNKPGYIYVPGYGYVKDEGGGVITGDNPNDENNLSGNKIGTMN